MRDKVLVDVDGVLYDILNAAKSYLKDEYVDFNPNNVTTYNLGGDIGCSKKQVYSCFNKPSVLRCGNNYDGAIEALKKLQRYVDVYAYTNACKDVIHVRNEYLKKYGILGEAFLSGDSSITTYKPKLRGYVAVFEDNPEVYDVFKDIEETEVYLIQHSYNKHLDGYYDFANAVNCFLVNNGYIWNGGE